MLGHTQCLGHDGLQGCIGLALLGHGIDGVSLLAVAHDVGAIAAAGLDERTVGFLSLLGQALVEHARHYVHHIVLQHIGHGTLHLAGHGVALEHELDDAVLLLLVLVADDNDLIVVGHGLGDHLCGIGCGCRDGAEHLLDLAFHVVDIDVANHNDGLVVRTIPLVVVVTNLVVLEVVDHAHQTDGHALAVLRTRIECLEIALEHALAGAAAQTPLLVDDTTLLVDLVALEQQAI